MTLMLCAFTTFCVASGFCVWLLTAPLLLVNGGSPIRARKCLWAIWCSAAVASVAFYFRGYERPPWHPSPLEGVKHPALAGQFIFAYLGSGLDRVIDMQMDAWRDCVTRTGASSCSLDLSPASLLTPQIIVALLLLAALALAPIIVRKIRRRSSGSGMTS